VEQWREGRRFESGHPDHYLLGSNGLANVRPFFFSALEAHDGTRQAGPVRVRPQRREAGSFELVAIEQIVRVEWDQPAVRVHDVHAVSGTTLPSTLSAYAQPLLDPLDGNQAADEATDDRLAAQKECASPQRLPSSRGFSARYKSRLPTIPSKDAATIIHVRLSVELMSTDADRSLKPDVVRAGLVVIAAHPAVIECGTNRQALPGQDAEGADFGAIGVRGMGIRPYFVAFGVLIDELHVGARAVAIELDGAYAGGADRYGEHLKPGSGR
jgi:hypothetical protein